jgi:hypothetical protein
MNRQDPIPIVEYMLVALVLLLVGAAVLQWLSPVISSLATYPMFHPMGIVS